MCEQCTVLALTAVLVVHSASAAYTVPRYTNSWAVEVRGGVEVADELARKHGFVNAGEVSQTVESA